MEKRKQITADLFLLMVTVVWGGTFVMVKDAVSLYPVFRFLTVRFALATLVLLMIGWRRLATLGRRGVVAGVLIGLFLFVGYGLQTMGLQYTSASKAGFITGLSVVIVPILSALVLRRQPAREALLGVTLATVGLALLTLNHSLSIARGDLLILACAFSFAAHIVSVSAFAPRVDPLALTIVQVATVAVLSAVVSLLVEPAFAWPTPPVWAAAGFTGILATAVAFAVQNAVQRFTTPTHTALIFTGEPVFAALFGVLLAGDVMTPAAIAGGALIIAGTVISEIRWSERTAVIISRFFGPHYVVAPMLLVMGLSDPISWKRGLVWAFLLGAATITGMLLVLTRQMRKGRISDWHISRREERLQPVLIIASFLAGALPVAALLLFDGPRPLLVATLSGLGLILFNHVVTLWWKISQHVSSIAVSVMLVIAALGAASTPLLLLIPLVAWARVKIGAHTVMQTVAGGIVGMVITFITLRVVGFA
ncbi:MAG TPA: DMT family transporter [Chloroflexi bacterium]|nr:DMT family transporter [Chloroflexota bacterium]